MVLGWPLRENGAERIYTAIVKVGFCHVKCVLKSCIGRNGRWAVRIWQNRCQTLKTIKNNKLIKLPLGDVFFSYFVIFPATLLSFCQSESQNMMCHKQRKWVLRTVHQRNNSLLQRVSWCASGHWHSGCAHCHPRHVLASVSSSTRHRQPTSLNALAMFKPSQIRLFVIKFSKINIAPLTLVHASFQMYWLQSKCME